MSKKSNKFKTSAPMSNEKFELLNGSYSVSDIQDYFKYIIKKLETATENPPIRKKFKKFTRTLPL